MTISSVPSIRDGCITVRGKAVLTSVPSNVTITPISSEGAFLGACSQTSSSLHTFCLGILKGFRLTCLFRFKIWWMIPGYGESGRDVPTETQMLLLEAKDGTIINENFSEPTTEGTFYILLLPGLDGPFRTSLQGTIVDELEFCAESGDPNVETTKVMEAVYVNSGDNPFKLIRNSMKILEKHKGTFRHIDNKELPAHIDWFGWNTWDAFYTNVSAQGIDEGLKRFSEEGCLPKWVCIDDGWQNTTQATLENGELPIEKVELGARLQNLKENAKFKGKGCGDLHQFIRTIKQKYGLKYVYAWHALLGYWGGLDPLSDEMRKYNPKIEPIVYTPGNLSHVVCGVVQMLEKVGVGLIDPLKIDEFYNDLHGYLARCGVDGVKVDVQCLLDTLGSGYGGRVILTKCIQEALEESVMKNFGGNNIICSMSTNNDYIFCSKRSASARASEDFMPNEPTFQTLHVAAVAFNSLLLGEIVIPDWDMFHSTHYTAEFHAAARALGGCPVYVSDEPGQCDVNIIRKLVLPDGSILRAKHAGRPTRDCLFDDPVMDGKSLLKIWNLNKLSGIVGIFNCQKAGKWPPTPGAISLLDPTLECLTITGSISAADVDSLQEVADEDWNGDSAVYAFNSGKLSKLPKGRTIEVSLGVLKCEVFTISPIRVFGPRLEFAPIGLVDMFNSGGATEALGSYRNQSGCVVKIQVRGCGRFGAYSNTKPSYCLVEKAEVDFTYHASNGLLTLELQGDCKLRGVEVFYQDFDVTSSEGLSVLSAIRL
ncbi:probable galactinol--sucrose galactosyltransferase 2 [Gastrolobium bilobum]|uniref:probable galactinol--sucrose galactosyltransferase 2 n=1 Tax=Gastrolobium bilobum TaxID=150636 RepID=UPI002AB32041|nr:probable galactinol--sucrose galactosyltransferase 2 [Gastrolobium bilobum]